MELWLDTLNKETIETAKNLDLTGITTNPSIIAGSHLSLEKTLEQLFSFYQGPVAVQVLAQDFDSILLQARELVRYNPHIIAKIPATIDGFKAIRILSQEGILTMATAVFELKQVYFAAKAGANYVAPYLSRIEGNATQNLKKMQSLLFDYHFGKTKLLAASIKTIEQITFCLENQIAALTMKESLFDQWLLTPDQTEQFVKQFEQDWQTVSKSHLFSF